MLVERADPHEVVAQERHTKGRREDWEQVEHEGGGRERL